MVGGKPRRLASSSAKYSSLAVSSQQNSEDTAAPFKPTKSEISAAGLLNLSWPWINHFVSPTHNVIGIHMKNLPRAFSWNQKGLKVFLEAKNMKGYNLCFNIHSEVTQGDRFFFCILSRLKCNAAQYVVSLIRMKHAISQQNLCCHHSFLWPPSKSDQ